MLALPQEAIEKRAQKFIEQITDDADCAALTATIVAGQSAIGGGSGPNVHPSTTLIALKHETLSAGEIERKLRLFATPVIARIADGLVLIDLRTVAPAEEPELRAAVRSAGK
jgi:L-seryl-tRNA(Ser) seleniumtransferase